jgi:hypothetical protein
MALKGACQRVSELYPIATSLCELHGPRGNRDFQTLSGVLLSFVRRDFHFGQLERSLPQIVVEGAGVIGLRSERGRKEIIAGGPWRYGPRAAARS